MINISEVVSIKSELCIKIEYKIKLLDIDDDLLVEIIGNEEVARNFLNGRVSRISIEYLSVILLRLNNYEADKND